MLNDKRIKSCLSRFESDANSRLQFLRTVSHSVGAHIEPLQPRDDSSSISDDEDEVRQAPVPAATIRGVEIATAAAATTSDDCCEVCLVHAPRAGFALVPCGHARFCEACAIQSGPKK